MSHLHRMTDRIQRRWEEREVGYKTAFALVALSGVVLLVRRRPAPR